MSNLPDIENVAAPWQLTGAGYIMLFRFSPDFIASQGFISKEMVPHYQGGLCSAMLVDYQHSDAGPYQELLFIPGRFQHSGQRYYSISKIYVSSISSVLNGRRNWGIPKELAEFKFGPVIENRQSVRVLKADQLIAAFEFKVSGPRLPVTTNLLPQKIHTIFQHYNQKNFLTTPGGRGSLRYARLLDVKINPDLFPDLAQGRLLSSVHASDFNLCFPAARIQVEGNHAA